MKIVKAQNANELFIKIAKLIWAEGETRVARELETREINDEICLILENPKQSIVTLAPRHNSRKVYEYLKAEIKFFLSGSLQLKDINSYSRFWNKIANADGTINSNYGYYTFFQKTNGISQFEWCLNRLKNDLYSRQAVINLNQPMHKYEGNKDFLCTLGQQFIVRDGKLDTVVWMRSNDFIYGLTYNIVWFTFIQQLMAEKLGLTLGKYTHIATTLHTYAKHYQMTREIADFEISEKDEINALSVWKEWQLFCNQLSVVR